MRLILGLLAIANLRWAAADNARAERLMREADDAHDRAEARLGLSRGFLDRSRILRA